ncbi:sugar ABC transporter substrate-binding protein [Oscillospiraceae bacterium PP1C4]
MEKQKILCRIGVLFALLLLFCACSTRKDTTVPDSTEQLSQPRSIAFAHKSINSYFYIIINEAVKRSAEERGWKFETSVADYDQIRQNNQIANLISKQPDAIITTSIDSTGIVDAVELANEAGIPMCIIDTESAGGNLEMMVSFDNYRAGQMAAEEIVNRLIEKYGVAKGVVFNAYGLENSDAWRKRKEGFENIILRYPGITYVAKCGEGEYVKVREALLAAYAVYPWIDAVHCSSDHPGRGMIEALQQTGNWKRIDEPGHVIVVTIDGEPCSVDNIATGYYDASIVQDAVSYGKITADLLDRYTFKGGVIPAGKYDSDNTYWGECDITMESWGTRVNIPPYVMNSSNYADKRNWANIARQEWGFEYK